MQGNRYGSNRKQNYTRQTTMSGKAMSHKSSNTITLYILFMKYNSPNDYIFESYFHLGHIVIGTG